MRKRNYKSRNAAPHLRAAQGKKIPISLPFGAKPCGESEIKRVRFHGQKPTLA
jgi:hypothetical protein